MPSAKEHVTLRFVILVMALTLGIAATDAASASGSSIVLRLADANPPNSLDPIHGTGCCWRDVTNALFRGLVTTDPAQGWKPVPDLAASWQVSSDKLSWTFTLKPGIRFHDDTPLDAEAVKFSFDRLLNKDNAATRWSSYDAVIDRIEVVDPLTVRFYTKGPYAFLIELMLDRPSPLIVSPTQVRKVGHKSFSRQPVGAGPMKFVEWTPDRIVLERWAGYYGKPWPIDRLEHLVVPEDTTRTSMLLTGEIDVAQGLTPDDIKLVQGHDGVRVVKSLQTTQTEGNPKMAKASPLRNPHVRQAINYAIDKEAIVESVYRNIGKCITGPASPRLADASDFGCWPYDPDKARQLLADAGYPNGFTMKWGYTKRWGGFDEMVQAVQAYLANVGIQVIIEKYAGLAEASPAASQPLDAYTDPPTMFQFIHTSPFLQYHLARLYMTRPYDQKSTYNIGYSNPRVDALLTATSAEFDAEKRRALFQEAQRLIWEDAAQIWLYQPEALVGVSDRIENFVMSSLMEPWIEVWRVRPHP